MPTFSTWLYDQVNRSDQAGYVAKTWRDLPQKPRLSSPLSIEKHLRDRGLWEAQEGLAEAWEVMMSEYRQQRLVAAAQEAGVTPEQFASRQPPLPGMSPGELVSSAAAAGTAAAAAVTTHVSLASLDAKLDAICAHLGIAPAGEPGPEPIDWQAIWDESQPQQAAGE
jgi:hypothetical protein